MPVMIENIQNDYVFTFTIDRLLKSTAEIRFQKRKEKADSMYQ